MTPAPLYRTIWRWHFYAGLFVVPMVLILALSGALYLFKPQVERWEERAFQHLPTAGAVMPDTQVHAALAAMVVAWPPILWPAMPTPAAQSIV